MSPCIYNSYLGCLLLFSADILGYGSFFSKGHNQASFLVPVYLLLPKARTGRKDKMHPVGHNGINDRER
jgi:hypothetical protein